MVSTESRLSTLSPSRLAVPIHEGRLLPLLPYRGFLPATPYNKINIHVGGTYGDKVVAMDRFAKVWTGPGGTRWCLGPPLVHSSKGPDSASAAVCLVSRLADQPGRRQVNSVPCYVSHNPAQAAANDQRYGVSLLHLSAA